jgi:hypothetical protein
LLLNLSMLLKLSTVAAQPRSIMLDGSRLTAVTNQTAWLIASVHREINRLFFHHGCPIVKAKTHCSVSVSNLFSFTG